MLKPSPSELTVSARLPAFPFPSNGLPSTSPTQVHRQRLERYIATQPNDAARNWLSPWCHSSAKRYFDILGAGLLLVLASPVFLAAAVAIKLDTPGPVFFGQLRTGLAGRRFRIFKFRTMRMDADRMKEALRKLSLHGPSSPDFKIRNDPRVTSVGRFLRRLSVDELPNLINVIRGDMSLVGPRPTTFDVDAYADWHLARLAVPPGLTGLWQISGRSEIDFDHRVEIDCFYIREQSLFLDLKILILTPLRVLRGRGAY